MKEEPKYRTFTLVDMAKDLKVSTMTIRRMIRRKGFAPCYLVGGQLRCDYEDFYRWKDEQKESFEKNYRRV